MSKGGLKPTTFLTTTAHCWWKWKHRLRYKNFFTLMNPIKRFVKSTVADFLTLPSPLLFLPPSLSFSADGVLSGSELRESSSWRWATQGLSPDYKSLLDPYCKIAPLTRSTGEVLELPCGHGRVGGLPVFNWRAFEKRKRERERGSDQVQIWSLEERVETNKSI